MNPIEFARNLFLLRREHKMTIEDLAAALEVTPEMICEWECAKTSPTLDQMNRLAKVYGIPLADVIRSPKPHNDLPKPAPAPAEEPAPEPEPPIEEPETEPETVVKQKKKEPSAWEILVIVLLILIIATALAFLIKPEWFPFRDLFGSWNGLRSVLPRL